MTRVQIIFDDDPIDELPDDVVKISLVTMNLFGQFRWTELRYDLQNLYLPLFLMSREYDRFSVYAGELTRILEVELSEPADGEIIP